MAFPVRSKKPEAVVVCANCGHSESEHGTTGTRPCLAAVGPLADRDFCACDDYRPKAARAAA